MLNESVFNCRPKKININSSVLKAYSFYLIILILPASKNYPNKNFLFFLLFSLLPSSPLSFRDVGPNFLVWRVKTFLECTRLASRGRVGFEVRQED